MSVQIVRLSMWFAERRGAALVGVVHVKVRFSLSSIEPHVVNFIHSKYTLNQTYAKLGVGSARRVATQPHPLPGMPFRS